MTRLLIGNLCDEDFASTGVSAADWKSQLIFWYAEDGDVIVLSSEPAEAFARYVNGLMGVRRDSLQVVVVSPGEPGDTRLTRGRLTDRRLLADVRRALAGR